MNAMTLRRTTARGLSTHSSIPAPARNAPLRLGRVLPFLALLVLISAWPAAAAVPVQGDGGIVFSYLAPDAGAVFLAGDFNSWNAEDLALDKGTDGVWRTTVELAAGQYEYKFVVDGAWNEDPDNPQKKADPFGGSNSLVEVDADGSVGGSDAPAVVAAPTAAAAGGGTGETPETFTVGRPRAVDGGIQFTYHDPDAGQVTLAGSFNDWNAEELPLTGDGKGNWVIVFNLPAGGHEYKFVADGTWIADPENPDTQDDPYGGSNSLVTVDADGSVGGADAPAATVAPPAAAATGDALGEAPEKFTVGRPKAVDGGIQFTYHDPSAAKVNLAGSFNGWNAEELPLTGDGKGNWVIVYSLPAGGHEYKFVADGAWMADPENPDTQADPYGGANSLVTVDANGKLVAAGTAEDSARPRSNNSLNARVYMGGRYLTRFEFAKNVPVTVGDEGKVDPRYRLKRPGQTVDLNFDTQVSDLTETYMRIRMDSDQNIIQNNVAGFLDEARLTIHPDKFTLRAFWNQEVFTGGDLLRLGGNIDLPGTILHDGLDFGKGSAGGLFTADPVGVHVEALFANVHNQDYYNDPDLFDNVGEDRVALRLSKRYGKFEVGVPVWMTRSLVWLDFGTLVGLPSTGIPALDLHRQNTSDSSTWYEVESHDYNVGVDLRYQASEQWLVGVQGMYVDRVQRFVTGNEAGQNNTNGALDLPFLERDRKLFLAHADWKPQADLSVRLQHMWADMDGATSDQREMLVSYKTQDLANRNIFFNLGPSPAVATMDSTDLDVRWQSGDKEAELWLRRASQDMDYGAVDRTVEADATQTSHRVDSFYLAGRFAVGATDDRMGRSELELGYHTTDLGVAGLKSDALELIFRYDRDLTRNTGLIADLRWITYGSEADASDPMDDDFFAPFVGLRYSPIRKLELVAAYGLDPVDYSIDYSGRQLGRWWYRQNYLFDNPGATQRDAEQQLEDARVITLRAQLQF